MEKSWLLIIGFILITIAIILLQPDFSGGSLGKLENDLLLS
jgi:hypothetical protein